METMKKLFFSTLLLLLFGELFPSAFAAGTDLQKTYTWKYSINKDAGVIFDNYDCNLTIHIWDKGETEYRLTVDATTPSEEDAAVLDKYLQNMKFSNSATSVRFRSSFWESRNTIMGRMKMKLEGSKDVSLTEFSMKGELWIPSGCRFELISKYSVINMEDYSGPLTLDLYNDNLYGGNVGGKTELEDKYSTIEFKDMKDLIADLYNSKLEATNLGNLNIESKYSKVTAVTSGNLEINSYNDKYSITKTGDITFKAKYSDLKTESSGQLNFNCYEGTIVMKEIKDIKLISKYADFQFASAGNISITSSYNDKLVAGKLNSLVINESKYCSFRIDELISSITESDGYEDKFSILKTDLLLKEINITGKYVDISLALPKATDFRFRANIQYPKLDLDESMFKIRTKISEGSQLEYDAIKGTEKDGMLLIEVNGYQMSLKLVGI
jgi:hypothetical protein